jgi:phosphohistidine phosphatase
MRVYLLRHGIAVERKDPLSPADFDRPLTPKGMNKTRAAAFGLRKLGVKPDAVFSSPWLRAMQTAEILCEVVGYPSRKIVPLDSLKGTSPASDLFLDLAKHRAKEVICVGHEPHLHQVIGLVLHAKVPVTELRKAGLACLELNRISPPRGRLLALYPARTLRLLGK